jgi:cytoskeleton protein RodZ
MPDTRNEAALGLGERLRSARKARALTLEQAAFTLRLEAPVLRALEDERYETLGAAVFVRGHLKAYARLLGLSEEAVLAAYRAADPAADAPPKVTRDLEKPLTTPPGPLAVAAAVAFVVIALLVLYALGSDPPAPAGPTLPVGQAAPPVAAPVPDAAPTDGFAPVFPDGGATSAPPAAATPATGAVDPAPATASPAVPAAVPAPASPAPASPPASGNFE